MGVILGPDSGDQLESLQAETRARGMQLHAEHVRSEAELLPALEDVLEQSDVLLSLPDSLLFNAKTIQSVLFTSYRSGDPVIGFSPAYVQAGALVAVHSTPTQLARQVMEMLGQPACRQRRIAGASVPEILHGNGKPKRVAIPAACTGNGRRSGGAPWHTGD